MVRTFVAAGALFGMTACVFPAVYGPDSSIPESKSESFSDEAVSTSDGGDDYRDAAVPANANH
ncbi:MAG: hypothetical protein IKW83_10920 [Muribaculaceae bacterium]|nr:hypothetical protein [Muribaculaceae bacterium]